MMLITLTLPLYVTISLTQLKISYLNHPVWHFFLRCQFLVVFYANYLNGCHCYLLLPDSTHIQNVKVTLPHTSYIFTAVA